jgi:hypothetical protein
MWAYPRLLKLELSSGEDLAAAFKRNCAEFKSSKSPTPGAPAICEDPTQRHKPFLCAFGLKIAPLPPYFTCS